MNLAFDAVTCARHDLAGDSSTEPATGTEEGRVTSPAGDSVVNLPEGVAIAPLESADADWPQAEYRTKDFRFRGYFLDKLQRPTFKYERGEVAIEDTPLPLPGASEDEVGKIKRVIELKAKNAPKNLYFRLAQGSFEKKGSPSRGPKWPSP